jgi:hypothetical protein
MRKGADFTKILNPKAWVRETSLAIWWPPTLGNVISGLPPRLIAAGYRCESDKVLSDFVIGSK